MAGMLKDFFDRSLEFREKISGKPAVAFVSAGGRGEGCLESIENMINAFGMKRVREGVVSVRTPGDKELDTCRELGRDLAKSVKS
jgi:flavorubredoxin